LISCYAQLARRLGRVPYWVLEKDYALSYLLAGIVATPALHESLILKGGTALRKGYFDDYRFSEDLDFSLRPDQSLPNVDDAVRHAVGQMVLLLL
jgi:predicted nucleotidyltransferase component of viral defense system